MEDIYAKIQETTRFLRKKGVVSSSTGIVLGTGLGSLAKRIKNRREVSFDECPNFPDATAIGHAGSIVSGTLAGKKIIAMEGRLHPYEGLSLKDVTFPIRVMKAMGVKKLILSNAAGGMNPHYELGDLMLISDHINFMGDSPLIGPNDDRLGPRFPDMSEPYDMGMNQTAKKCAIDIGLRLHEGVYVSVMGPQLETKAEYRFLRSMGADAVGMSTVPEVIVAVHAGLKVLAISCITDLCLPDALEPVDIDRIITTAKKSEPILAKLVEQIIKSL